MATVFTVNLYKLARFTNAALVIAPIVLFAAGTWISFYIHFLTVASLFCLVVNLFYRHVQTEHAILRNFGVLGQGRYLLESVGPELRQYLYTNDREERPFNRMERTNIYRKSKNIDSATSFGSLLEYDAAELKMRHSMFPTVSAKRGRYRLVIGTERGVAEPYVLERPMMISAMSYGALGSHAVRALARGAALAGIAMNTGEGGYPKYHLMEGADLIFQIGTAKFGVRTPAGDLDPKKLAELAAHPRIKMIEIKFSQGAKPGKGGLLPKEKITPEIAELRGIPADEDAVSPPYHRECVDLESTVAFIRRVQECVSIPVGIKLCIGSIREFRAFVEEMKRREIFPDYIAIDGGEGGTGAAPGAFVDWVGMPLYPALYAVTNILTELGVRERMKVFAAGKLVDAGRQAIAFALGADAIYSARGFMFSIGCIQARQCANNTCPVGITTHDPELQAGLVPATKAERVKNYVDHTLHELEELVVAMGKSSPRELTTDDLYIPTGSNLRQLIAEDPILNLRLQPESAVADAPNLSHKHDEDVSRI